MTALLSVVCPPVCPACLSRLSVPPVLFVCACSASARSDPIFHWASKLTGAAAADCRLWVIRSRSLSWCVDQNGIIGCTHWAMQNPKSLCQMPVSCFPFSFCCTASTVGWCRHKIGRGCCSRRLGSSMTLLWSRRARNSISRASRFVWVPRESRCRHVTV